MPAPELVVVPTAADIVERVWEALEVAAREAIAARGRFTLALSGGSTPKALYQRLASPDVKDKFDWPNIVILFGDDRAVAPDDKLSNYRMARETLLDFVPAQVERIATESDDLEAAAAAYEAKIHALGEPIDVVLLGMGPDGHTASLFPHSPQLDETERFVVATPVASFEPHVRRITFTFPLINSARQAWFLVAGKDKATRVAEIIQGPKNVAETPAQGVDLREGKYVWFLDEGAAGELK
jgi:6-phosphogluconolactonase